MSRNQIINYLVHQLKGISNDPTTNRANGVAQLTNGAVTSVTLDFPGRFYNSATVEFSSPGQVTANVIPTVANGNVSFTVDVGGGSYTVNPSIELEITRDNVGFTSEQAKFGNNSWEINTAASLPFTLPSTAYGTLGFWVWPSAAIPAGNFNFMRVGGDTSKGVIVYVQNYQGVFNIGIHLEDEPFPNNASVSSLTTNAWNYINYTVYNAGSDREDVSIHLGGSGAGSSSVDGYTFTDSNVQMLTGTANGLVYVDDLHWTTRTTTIFPDPTTANPEPGSTFYYEDFESPPTFNTTITTNAAISSNTVVAVSAINTNYSITAAAINSVDAPANSLPPATGTVQVNSTTGIVTGVTILNGSSYSSPPTVTFSNSNVAFASTPTQVFRTFKYMDDINDFPTLTFVPSETVSYFGDGQVLKSMTQSIRGYVKTDREDSLESSENLANDVETVVSRFAQDASNLSVHRSQVTSLRTDDGLMTPYGVCEVGVEIFYEEST